MWCTIWFSPLRKPPIKPARVLIIAGSDSSGGAGIQADIKTATALGAYAMTAITTVTVQDTKRVYAVQAIQPKLVQEQIVRVLADIGADAIKIGMLGDAAIVRAVADILKKSAKRIPIVLDPVMVAKGGSRLLATSAVAALKRELLPLATLVTPNLPEAAALTGVKGKKNEDIVRAGHKLIEMGANAALIKGGHSTKATVDDVLVWAKGVDIYAFPRIKTKHTHGTGCTLSTAIACYLGQGLPLAAAIGRAREYVQKAIETAPGFGHGHGPLNHLHPLQAD
jgi:hydroxymethylpyrimidine/phosphomethylpyrimidine kinase